MATHSSVLAWRIAGMGEPGGLPSMGLQSWVQLKRLSSSSSSDRVPDELWMEVHDIVQDTGVKTIPMERNAKKQNGCLGRPYK